MWAGFLTFRNRPDAVTDIYATDVDNESLVVAYVEHIYAYLFHREVRGSPLWMLQVDIWRGVMDFWLG